MKKCEWPRTSLKWEQRKDIVHCEDGQRKLVGDRYYCPKHAENVLDMREWLMEWMATR